MVEAGINDPAERAEILTALETANPMLRMMRFKTFAAQRAEKSKSSKT